MPLPIRGYSSNTDWRLILWDKKTGAWLSILGNTVSGTVFPATEFRDFLCTRYNSTPLNLQINYDRCGTTFGANHTLSCSKCSLVIARQNEAHDEILYIARQAFTPASVRVKPLIHQGRTRSESDIIQGSEKDKETRGCMMV